MRHSLERHIYAEVRQPLRLEKLRGRVVERVLRVVGIDETVGFGAGRVGGKEKAPGSDRVVDREPVGVVAEITLQAFGDDTAGRGDARDIGAQVFRELGPVDREAEGEANVMRRLALVERERAARRAFGVGDHVEAHEVRLIGHLEDQLALRRRRLDPDDVGGGRRVGGVAEQVVRPGLVLGESRGRVGHDLDVHPGQRRLGLAPPRRNRDEVQ